MVVSLWPVLALSVAVLVWGTTFVVSSDALSAASPAALTVARFAIAALVLLPLAVRRTGFAAALGSPRSALLGLTGVAAYYGLQNAGLLYTTAGTAALLQAGLPLATVALAATFLGERPGPAAAFGLLLATAGVVLIAGAELARLNLGALLVIGGVLAYAVYTVQLRGQPRADPLVLSTATCVWGLAFLLPWQLWEVATGRAGFDMRVSLLVAVTYLGVVASAGTLVLWTYGAARLSATTAGAFTAPIPAVGYALAVLGVLVTVLSPAPIGGG